MKKFSVALLITTSFALVACNSDLKMNGSSLKTANKSVRMIKNRLSEEMRIEYEVSFWTIRDVNKSDSDFLNAVDGKTPQEIIAKGKEIYQQRKEAGVPEYQKYKSWEEMITKFGRERIDQTKVKSDVRNNIPDPKTGNRDITYHL